MDNHEMNQYFDGDTPLFENSSHQNGHLWWYASELMHMLGYADYSPTMKPIQKALLVCLSSNIDTSDNFREEWKETGGKKFKDFKLSRFACYLITLNSDIKKPIVAKAQAYFAAFTATVQQYIRDNEDVERVSLRAEVTDHEKNLSSTVKQSGVINYAYFQNRGYIGLYNMPLKKIKELKGLPDERPLFDFMGSEELGANIFRITQTEAKIKRENIYGQTALEVAAQSVGREVRNAIRSMGGTLPENLPPQEDIKKIKSDLKKTNKEFKKNDARKIADTCMQ
ncbi:MAG: DNA damage-inducible protein D [Spirochaetaceae bacterium]|nr:DNA damage-inducible protein D [Spirochaetaceae bacterium]